MVSVDGNQTDATQLTEELLLGVTEALLSDNDNLESELEQFSTLMHSFDFGLWKH